MTHPIEGDIYSGSISISGGQGPARRWIVVAPFGKPHIHSIDDPLELHSWPISLVHEGIEKGTLQWLGTDPVHPALILQRVKEQYGIRDAHLGLNDEAVEHMLELLWQAALTGEAYAPYAAGEILALSYPVLSGEPLPAAVLERIEDSLGVWEQLTAGGGRTEPACAMADSVI